MTDQRHDLTTRPSEAPAGPPSDAADATTAELVRSHARLRALAAASHAFSMVATDYSLLLERIAATTAELIGDGCIVTLLDASGKHLINVANAHRDPALALDYRTYLAGREISKAESATVSAAVIRTGTPQLVHDMSPELLIADTDEALKPLVARLNVHSYVVVPIRTRQTILGTLSLMRSGPGRGYVPDDLTLLQDLADRAGLALENARLYGELERRVRQRTAELEAVNQELEAFSYSVAHDLRAPLLTIDGYCAALLEDFGERLGPTATDYLNRTRTASSRMGLLISDLLALSRSAGGELERTAVDVSELARTVLARLRDAEPARDIQVVVQTHMLADADARLVEVVLTNLLDNAWKFTSKRDTTRIEVASLAERRPTVYFVRDNGAGFDSNNARKLFGVFQRLHHSRDFKGTGIGLATVQRIVRRHGGRIWAEAELDRGATFYFTLEAE